jgi:hypothetical protein
MDLFERQADCTWLIKRFLAFTNAGRAAASGASP